MRSRSEVSKLLFAVPLCVLLLASAAFAGEANLFLGQKSLSEDDADHRGYDSQTEFGVTTSWDFEWPVALAVDILSSSDDVNEIYTYDGYTYDYDVDVSTMELNVGVRKFWGDKIRPYIGGGAAMIKADVDIVLNDVTFGGRGTLFPVQVVDDSDTGFGFFLNAGVLWRIGSRFQVGIDVRHSDAKVDIEDEFDETAEREAGGTHYGVLLGAHW